MDKTLLHNHDSLHINHIQELNKKLRNQKKSRKDLYSNLSYQQRVDIANQYPQIYSFWQVLIARCYNTKHFQYKYWGGSGFFVIDGWRYDKLIGFINFIIDIGTLDYRHYALRVVETKKRIDSNAVYWVSRMSGSTSLSDAEIQSMKNNSYTESERIIMEVPGFDMIN